MADNYVKKRQYTGLKETGGQVELTTEPVVESALITAEADDKEARKNGGGAKAESKASTK